MTNSNFPTILFSRNEILQQCIRFISEQSAMQMDLEVLWYPLIKIPVKTIDRYFVFNNKQGLLTEENKSAIFANCRILKSYLWILRYLPGSPNY
jgi:hypothetical protein